MEQTSTNWTAIAAVTVTVIMATIGAAVGYLRLFIRSEIGSSNKEIMAHIDGKFALKELMTEKFDSLETNINIRFSAIEGRLEALERRT